MVFQYGFPSFADSNSGCYQRKQVIADFIMQNDRSADFGRAIFHLLQINLKNVILL